MIFASGYFPRMAWIASMPFMSGKRRSIKVSWAVFLKEVDGLLTGSCFSNEY